MIAATVAVLTPVSRLSSGVYSSVAAAEKATMARNSGGSCPTPTPTSGLAPCSYHLASLMQRWGAWSVGMHTDIGLTVDSWQPP